MNGMGFKVCSITAVCALLLCAPCNRAFSSAPARAAVAVPLAGGGVRILLLPGERTPPGLEPLQGARWRPWSLIAPRPEDPRASGGVFAIGGRFPRLRVRADYDLILFSGRDGGAAGLAWVGAAGAGILLLDPDPESDLRRGEAVLAPGGGRLALVAKRSGAPRILVVETSGPKPRVREAEFAAQVEEIEPESLALTGGALFVAAEGLEGGVTLYRARIGGAGPITLLPVAGPFPAFGPEPAVSEGALAFLAGEDEDEVDVFVVREEGGAANVTRSPARYIPHTRAEPRIAVAPDGAYVAYQLEIGGDRETFLSPVGPSPAAPFHVTADERFNPYIDQEIWIFFHASNELVFAGGHDVRSSDLYRIRAVAGTSLDAVNLTRSGGTLLPPFAVGALEIGRVAVAAPGELVVAARRFPDARNELIATTTADGAMLAHRTDVRGVAEAVPCGGDLYLAVEKTDGAFALLGYRQGVLADIPGLTSAAPMRIVAYAARAAFLEVPGAGIARLEEGLHATLAVEGAVTGGAAVHPQGDLLAYGRADASGGVRVYALAAASGTETPLSTDPLAGAEVLAVLAPQALFVRGDATGDGRLDVADAVRSLAHLFLAAEGPACADALDTDDDGTLTVTDPVRTLLFLFRGAPPPPPPYPEPGEDPTPDALPCP